MGAVIYAFGDAELDDALLELRRNGEPCHVEPQVFDVLRYLVAHRDRVVSKEELLDNVWGDRYVSESALTSRLKAARKVLGDNGKEQRIIATVHGRGYRFVGDVDVRDQPDDGGGGARSGPGVTGGGGPAATQFPRRAEGFIGRSDELERINDARSESRLVTLIGPGGVGKTRLAVEHATSAPTDAVFVDLSGVTDGAQVGDVFLESLGVTPRAATSSESRLVEALDPRTVLLVVDNCEQVIAEVATLVAALLDRTDEVHVLATSREALNVAGEHVVAVAPFAVPPANATTTDARDNAAVQLFLDRSARAGGDPLEHEHELIAVAALCRRLDGLPLAIEFAAARTRTLTAAEILHQLDAGRALGGARRAGGPAHHVTLSDAIGWSYQLLDDHERSLLEGLSVFAGWFDVDACAGVTGGDLWDVTDRLTRLAEQSLVQSEVMGAAGRHFRLLQTVREFASQHVDAARDHELRARHMAFYADFVEATSRSIPGPDEDRALEQLRLALDDVRAASEHATACGATNALVRLALGPRLAVVKEAAAFARLALTAIDVDGVDAHPRYCDLLAAAAWGAVLIGDVPRARATAERAAEIADDIADHPRLCWIFPQATGSSFADGAELCRRAAERVANQGQPEAHVFLLVSAAFYRLAAGDETAAADLATVALREARAIGSRSLQARTGTALAYARRDIDPDGACEAANDVIALASLRDHHVETAHRVLGIVAGRRGDWPDAADHVEVAIRLLVEQGDATVQAVALRQLACLIAAHDARTATILLGAADRIVPGLRSMARDEDEVGRVEAAITGALGGEAASELRAQGQALRAPEVVACVRETIATMRAL